MKHRGRYRPKYNELQLAWFRKMACQGLTAKQIASRMGIKRYAATALARRQGITLTPEAKPGARKERLVIATPDVDRVKLAASRLVLERQDYRTYAAEVIGGKPGHFMVGLKEMSASALIAFAGRIEARQAQVRAVA